MLNSDKMPTGLYLLRDKESGQLSAAWLEDNRSYNPWQILGSDEIYDDRDMDKSFEVICQIVDGQHPTSGLYLVANSSVNRPEFPLVTKYELAEYYPPTDRDPALWEMTSDETMSWTNSDATMVKEHLTPTIGVNFAVVTQEK